MFDADEIPYRTMGLNAALPAATQVSSVDERNYNTLKSVRRIFADAIEGLYRDFNAFELSKQSGNAKAAQVLLRQIAGKQEAYEILAPLLDTVDSAIQRIDDKYKEG